MTGSPQRRGDVWPITSILAAALSAAVWGTWPLAAKLSTHVYDPRFDGGAFPWALGSDIFLTIWILAWDRHALMTQVTALFDANIFHPARLSLAFSENLLGAMPVYLPVSLLSSDAVAAHQATLILTFALAFAAAAVLVWGWTRCLGAAFVAGVVFAFSPFRVGNLASIHIEGNYLLPLIPLFARRVMDNGDGRAASLLCICLVLETMHSYYLGYAAFLTVGVLGLVRLLGKRGWAHVRAWVITVSSAAVVAAVLTIPYLVVRRGGTIGPPSDALLAAGSATLGHTGSTPALLVALITLPFWPFGMATAGRGVWVAALAMTVIVAHAVALGPHISIFGWDIPGPFRFLLWAVPGFEAVRVPVRFNAAASMAAAALAGIGLAGARRRLLPMVSDTKIVPVGGALAIVLLYVAVPSPLRTMPAAMTPQQNETAAWLARQPRAPLLEVPFVDVERTWGGNLEHVARAMYHSTRHWNPLLNGYSGYVPASYGPVASLASALPAPEAVMLLTRATGVRHIVVHRADLPRAERRRWRLSVRDSGLTVRAVVGSDVIYATDPDIPHDLLSRLIDPQPQPTTLQDTPRVPLAVSERSSIITARGPIPTRLMRGVPFELPITVRNASDATWPSLSPSVKHLVGLVYRWEDADGRRIAGSNRPQPLPWDLHRDEEVTTRIVVWPPPTTGAVAHLVVGLAQDETWFPDSVTVGSITMPRPR